MGIQGILLFGGIMIGWGAGDSSLGRPMLPAPEAVGWNVSQQDVSSESEISQTQWLSGEAAWRRLKESIGSAGILWKGTPLREALEGLAQNHGIAFVLDRRVDPGQPLELRLENCSLGEVFAAVAKDRGLGIALVGPVVYLGPPAVVKRLNTLIAMKEEHLSTFPPLVQKTFLAEAPLSWSDLAAPREILADLTASAGVSVVHADRVPHDLWARNSLPPLSLICRLSLVLYQFDLTFQIQAEGREIALVPLPERIALVRSYPAGSNPSSRAALITKALPEVEVRLSGEAIWVRGRIEDHHRIALLLDPSQKSSRPFWELENLLESGRRLSSEVEPASASSKSAALDRIRVDRLRIQNKPLGEVLDLLRNRLGLEFRIDPAGLQKAGVSLDQHISLEVERASVDDLLRAIFQPLGLRFQRRHTVVEVRP